jgi:hypothetical protein
VACNVRSAIDIFAPEVIWSLSTRLEPGPGFTGSLEPVEFKALGGDLFGHFTISVFDNLHRLIQEMVLEGDRVRRRSPATGEPECSPALASLGR